MAASARADLRSDNAIDATLRGVPTVIYFAAENLRLRVEEEPGQVAEAFASGQGLPIRLTARGNRDEVYVNPAMVAYWSASETGPESAVQQEPPPAIKQQAVTDIWGNPLRRKPRR